MAGAVPCRKRRARSRRAGWWWRSAWRRGSRSPCWSSRGTDTDRSTGYRTISTRTQTIRRTSGHPTHVCQSSRKWNASNVSEVLRQKHFSRRFSSSPFTTIITCDEKAKKLQSPRFRVRLKENIYILRDTRLPRLHCKYSAALAKEILKFETFARTLILTTFIFRHNWQTPLNERHRYLACLQ